ncbi:MAG: aminoglycoside phosphotransferase family protein [Candidatus Sulfotelmatobacter sp.]
MELDIEDFAALRDYLTEHRYVDLGETVAFKKLPGGVSNRTVRVSRAGGRGWVLKQALAKLRVQLDWFSSPERIEVEAKALRWLNHSAPRGTTPAFIFEDLANHLMGMEAIPEENQNWKSALLSGQIVSTYFEQFGLLLGTIHRRSSEDEAEVSRTFADTTYFESLRLQPYYIYTAQKTAASARFLNALAQETLHHKHSLVHGDFSPKNTLIYQNQLILLDYEVVHFGDPAFDVGFALTHFLSKAHHLPRERARLASAAALFWQAYRKEIAGLNWAGAVEPRVARHTLGCLLARVAGKSPLEYLTAEEMARQREIVLSLIVSPPTCVLDLIAVFVHHIETYAKN